MREKHVAGKWKPRIRLNPAVPLLKWTVLGLLGSIAAALLAASGLPATAPLAVLLLVLASSLIVASLVVLTSAPQSRMQMPIVGDDSAMRDPAMQVLLKGLADAAELHDNHTYGHCQRVAFNAERIGEYLGLTERERVVVRWGALLHDVGKAGLRDQLLSKPGRLTDDEFDEVKSHSQIGADILIAASPALSEIAALVLSHHERWDGRGYPQGLQGTEIPLGSRIIAVADVFEALTSARPYRAPVPPREAFTTIAAGSGTHFDPDVVAVFQRLFDPQHLEKTGAGSVEHLEVPTRFQFSVRESPSVLLTRP